MLSLIMTMFLACGEKEEDTAVEATEPATEETTEETGSEEVEGEDTATEEPADTGSEEADTGSGCMGACILSQVPEQESRIHRCFLQCDRLESCR